MQRLGGSAFRSDRREVIPLRYQSQHFDALLRKVHLLPAAGSNIELQSGRIA
jgi:hypothetical protein